LLCMSERTFRRWRDRHRASGAPGLDDRRLTPSPRRAPKAEIERMLGLYRDIYRGFTVKHFHEHMGKRHNDTLGYTVTKLHGARCTGAGGGPNHARLPAHSAGMRRCGPWSRCKPNTQLGTTPYRTPPGEVQPMRHCKPSSNSTSTTAWRSRRRADLAEIEQAA
jgi:hypothetical protein